VKDTIQKILLKQGQWRDSLSDQEVNDEQHPFCYYVAEGDVDLFLTQHSEDRPSSALKLFLSLQKGSFLVTKPVLGGHQDWHLHAKLSPNTKLIEFPYAFLVDVFQNPELVSEVEQIIAEWANRLTMAINSQLKPGASDFVTQNSTIECVEDKAYINETTDLLWVHLKTGQINLLGNPLKDIFHVPLITKAWITSQDKACIDIKSTDQIIKDNNLLSILQRFYEQVLVISIKNIKAREEIEEKQFQQGIEERSSTLNSALKAISNFYGITEEVYHYEGSNSSAKAACTLLCNTQGIDLTIPKEIPAQYNAQAQVNHILNNSQIRKREVALAGDWWNETHGGLIAFVKETQQVVVLLFDKKIGYLLVNPETGAKSVVDKNNAETLSPFAISIYRSFPNQPMGILDIVSWSLKHHKSEMKLILLITVCSGLLGLLTPWVTGQLFSIVIPRASYSLLAQLMAGLLAATFGMALFEAARGFTLARIQAFVDNNGVGGIWDRITKLPLSFFKNYGAGDLLNRASGFKTIVTQLFGVAASSLFDSVYALFYFALLFYYSISLSLICLGIMIIAGVCTFLILNKSIKIGRISADIGGHLSSLLSEYISGIQKVKTTASESYLFNNWANLFVEYRKLLFRSQLWSNSLISLNSVIPIISTAIIFWFASGLIQSGTLGLGGFLAFNAAFGALLAISLRLTTTLSTVLQLVPTFERVKPILDSPPEVQTVKKDPGLIKGKIDVDHVFFKYSQNAPLILKDVSFSVSQGEFVAIVGPSGSGKSTLLRLLLQFETPLTGGIFFDNQSIQELDINMVRRQIGVVLQNASLFPGSIFDNIIGSAPLTLDDAWLAAKHAGFDKDISTMPMGMHTMISEGSGGLSGGQKQRLLISRALVNRPNLLFFDEATSALDNATQQIVTESLDRLNATRIVIAHRLSTIINADKIIVLVDGKVEEMGNYSTLMAQQGVFYKMASRQIT
jgi:ATP-binding cassette subfamily C protein